MMKMTQTQQDLHWMKRCIELAEQAALLGEVPVGAVVVRDGELLGEGFNQSISHAEPTAHAEICGLRNACVNVGNYRIPDATLYVTLEPCAMCAGALVHARIKRLVFAALEPKAGVIVSQQQFLDASYLNHKIEYEHGCMGEQSRKLLQSFFRERRNQCKFNKKQH